MPVCPFIYKPFTIIFAYQRIITIFARVEIVKAHELHPNAGGAHGLYYLLFNPKFNVKMKRLIFMCAALLMCVVSVFAAQSVGGESVTVDFLDGFKSFVGISTVVVPAVVGFIASKLQNPMNRWVTMWVTAVVGVLVTLFSWWMNLGFPPSDASIWVVLIDALFVALASTGIVSVVTSEWLAKLFGGKVNKE